MKPASVLVVIVNYRTPELAIAAVASLEQEVRARGDTHVVVVDNDSGDGSAEHIGRELTARGWSGWASFLAEPRNGGFAAGNNAGLAWYRAAAGEWPEFVWLLNPDTLAKPGAIGGLVDYMRAHPQVGIAGGRCLWEDGAVRYSAFRFHSPRRELMGALDVPGVRKLLGGKGVVVDADDRPEMVDWVSGSNFMIRREVIEAVGPMDEGYFLYFEEEDYCAAAADAGFACAFVPASCIVHIGGQSTGVTGATARGKRRPDYWFFARARFFLKRYGAGATNLANLLWLLAYPVGRLLGRLRGKKRADPPYFWWDFLRNNYGRGGLMYRAKKVAA